MSDAGRQSADGDELRRRTWSADQKQQIISESFAPGASVAEVARRYGLNSNLLFTWRRREQAPDSASDAGEPVAESEKGMLLDKIGQHAQAFAAFSAGKRKLRELTGLGYQADVSAVPLVEDQAEQRAAPPRDRRAGRAAAPRSAALARLIR